MSPNGAVRAPVRSGTLLVLGLFAVLLIGWLFYRTTIPPKWLHDFGAAIAFHASADPNAPLPEDSRQETPRGLTNNPYICTAQAIPLPWDRMVVVTPGVNTQPLLALADWSAVPSRRSLSALTEHMAQDKRYQAIVLLSGRRVLDAQLFFTFWADLSALARPDGFSPANAIFTAAVKNGTYVLSVPEDVPANACDSAEKEPR